MRDFVIFARTQIYSVVYKVDNGSSNLNSLNFCLRKLLNVNNKSSNEGRYVHIFLTARSYFTQFIAHSVNAKFPASNSPNATAFAKA